MNITVERFITGQIETNTYLAINSDKQCLIVDPSTGCEKVLECIDEQQLSAVGIFITHGHFDHIDGIAEIVGKYPDLTVYIHANERTMLANPRQNMSAFMGISVSYKSEVTEYTEGLFSAGSFDGDVFCVPGHSPAGSALLLGEYLLCGDILFAGSIGRTDFPGGNHKLLLEGIKSKLMKLPDNTILCPGHGGRSTIGRERRMNHYLAGRL